MKKTFIFSLLILVFTFSCKKQNNDLTFQSVIENGGVFDDAWGELEYISYS